MKPYIRHAIFIMSCLCVLPSTQAETLPPHKSTLNWFRQARFGIFIHWDPRVLTVTNYGKSYREFKNDLNKIHQLYKQWNPQAFNAEEWVDTFKKAGVKYITFTTKHQYGYSNFDNPYTDYDVMGSPFKRDACKELADACRQADMKIMWYYSSEGGVENTGEYRHLQGMSYPDYRFKSIEHLLKNYGRTEGIWWDGGDNSRPELMDMVRNIQPHVITNRRLKVDGNRLEGDFSTPEQVIGAFNMERPWKSCVPLEGNEWFYCGGKDNKDTETCLKTLTQCASGDGNLLLNISPLPDGKLQSEQIETLLGMGWWLKKYGKSIYGTRGGPYLPGAWGCSTRKDDLIYLHLMQINDTGRLILPPLTGKILQSTILTEGKVSVTQSEEGITIGLDEIAGNPDISTIVVLKIEGNAMDITPIGVPLRESLTKDKLIHASSAKDAKFPPEAILAHSDLEKAFEKGARPSRPQFDLPHKFTWRERGFKTRYWSADEMDATPWITVDLGVVKTFSEIRLWEKYNRIRKFAIQYWRNNKWETLYDGEKMNYFSYKFKPVQSQKIRVVFLKTEGGAPGLRLFDIFE